MDKFGWQRPNLEPGATGIQTAVSASKMRKRAAKIEMIAAGVSLGDMRSNMMNMLK
tara:strand:+ start:180 stop:347 length:168 start_codon:yes stop_codon:yes gene_type:complete